MPNSKQPNLDAEVSLHEFSVRYRAALDKRFKLSAEMLKGIRGVAREQYEREQQAKYGQVEAPKVENPTIQAPAIKEPKIEAPNIESPKPSQSRHIEPPEPDI